MHRLALGLILIAASAPGSAEDINGIWITETNDSGGHLEVTVGPCESDAEKICGIITTAYSKDGVDPAYENLGKFII